MTFQMKSPINLSLFPLIFLFFSSLAVSHPHSFLDLKTTVLIPKGDQLTGFAMEWTLDEITSSELIYEIKTSANRAEAKTKILEELNQSLVNDHYFSELYDEQNQPIKFKAAPVKPSIEIKDNRLIYKFILSLAKPQNLAGRTFRFYTFEPSYYLAMEYPSAEFLTSTEQNLCKISLIEPKVNQSIRLYASQLDKNDTPDMPSDKSLSLGAQFAQTVSIVCRP